MKLIHIIRAFAWLKALFFTLLKFWLKNPQATPAIILFILKKSLFLPKFLDRNVMVEKHTQKFDAQIKKVVHIYKKYGEDFNLKQSNSYKKLNNLIQDRYILLYFIVRKLKPKLIVETGVASGISSGYILQAIKDNGFGKLYSIDLPFQWYLYDRFKLHLDSLPVGKMPGYLIPEGLKKNWKLILGNTYEELPKLLKNLKSIDLFFHDSEHTYKTMLFEYKTSWPILKNGGLLVSDDVDFAKAYDHFSQAKHLEQIRFKELGLLIKSEKA